MLCVLSIFIRLFSSLCYCYLLCFSQQTGIKGFFILFYFILSRKTSLSRFFYMGYSYVLECFPIWQLCVELIWLWMLMFDFSLCLPGERKEKGGNNLFYVVFSLGLSWNGNLTSIGPNRCTILNGVRLCFLGFQMVKTQGPIWQWKRNIFGFQRQKKWMLHMKEFLLKFQSVGFFFFSLFCSSSRKRKKKK